MDGQGEQVLKRGFAGVDVSGGEGGLRWGEETLFVNAAIMTRRYKPEHAPWVVDLDLPPAKEA